MQNTCGLQLCDTDNSSFYGAAHCARLTSGCQGSYNNHCRPYGLWSGAPYSLEYWSPLLSSGIFYLSEACDTGHCPDLFSFSVRCLLLALCGHGVRSHPYRPRLRCAVSWICSILQKMSYKDTCLQTTGLQLCDWYESSKYGAAQCGPFYGGCQGAMNNYCFPYVIWSSKQPSSTTHWSPELNGGKFFETLDPTGHHSLHAFTVRCVLDLKQLNPYQNLRKISAA